MKARQDGCGGMKRWALGCALALVGMGCGSKGEGYFAGEECAPTTLPSCNGTAEVIYCLDGKNVTEVCAEKPCDDNSQPQCVPSGQLAASCQCVPKPISCQDPKLKETCQPPAHCEDGIGCVCKDMKSTTCFSESILRRCNEKQKLAYEDCSKTCEKAGDVYGASKCDKDALGTGVAGCACEACTPKCDGKTCGDDGCGGQCEPGCTDVQMCNAAGKCICTETTCDGACCSPGQVCYASGCCTPHCENKQCGMDECGGWCGAFGGGCADTCSQECENGLCIGKNPCEKLDEDGTLVSIECGTVCGGIVCGNGNMIPCYEECKEGVIVKVDVCKDKQCGSDGCGSECGKCDNPEKCDPGTGMCVSKCKPTQFECFGPIPGQVECCDTENDICKPTGHCCAKAVGKYVCVVGEKCPMDGCGPITDSCEKCLNGCDDANDECIDCVGEICVGKCGTIGSCECGDECPNGGVCIANVCCQPQCDGKACGADGCGGNCGSCDVGIDCVNGTCESQNTDPCGDLTDEGCCDQSTLNWCEGGEKKTLPCGTSGCGWSPAGFYDCNATGADPSGKNPLACGEVACTADCADKGCGDDGCGGSCGQCATGESCIGTTCVPNVAPCDKSSECDAGEYCKKSTEDCDGKGQCVALPPDPCPTLEDVCGCDGNDYPDACAAAKSGASVASAGKCPTVCTPDWQCGAWSPCTCDFFDGCTRSRTCFDAMSCPEATGKPDEVEPCQLTSCLENADCPLGEFCRKAEGECEWPGECIAALEIPCQIGFSCLGPPDLVCGCDGKDYINECCAAESGVSVDFTGKCPCIEDWDCGPFSQCECDAECSCKPQTRTCNDKNDCKTVYDKPLEEQQCSPPDADEDGVCDQKDNCPNAANKNQEADMDNDGLGDVCDDDMDGDGVANDKDSCPIYPNPPYPNGQQPAVPGCCTSDSDVNCDDKDSCTTEKCVANACQNVKIANCCNDKHTCNDNLFCTADECKDGFCTFVPIGGDCCETTWDDKNPCTTDTCSPDHKGSSTNVADNTSCGTMMACANGTCIATCGKDSCQLQHGENCNTCKEDCGCDEAAQVCTKSGGAYSCCTKQCGDKQCGSDDCGGQCGPGCDDSDTCTTDECDTSTGLCKSGVVKTGCCNEKHACDDSNDCTDNVCKNNVCTFPKKGTCCNDLDCNDSHFCTADACDASYQCTYKQKDACCEKTADCGSCKKCTASVCVNDNGTACTAGAGTGICGGGTCAACGAVGQSCCALDACANGLDCSAGSCQCTPDSGCIKAGDMQCDPAGHPGQYGQCTDKSSCLKLVWSNCLTGQTCNSNTGVCEAVVTCDPSKCGPCESCSGNACAADATKDGISCGPGLGICKKGSCCGGDLCKNADGSVQECGGAISPDCGGTVDCGSCPPGKCCTFKGQCQAFDVTELCNSCQKYDCTAGCTTDASKNGHSCSGATMVCVSGSCEPCGKADQPCCENEKCPTAGLTCSAGKCVAPQTCSPNCGECEICAGTTCQADAKKDGNACSNSTQMVCQAGACIPCGDASQVCCVGQCNNGSLKCLNGTCSCKPDFTGADCEQCTNGSKYPTCCGDAGCTPGQLECDGESATRTCAKDANGCTNWETQQCDSTKLCSSGICVACGQWNQVCCPSATCADDSLECKISGTATETCQKKCTPTTCDKLGWECGQTEDGCGGILTCSACADEKCQTCSQGQCIAKADGTVCGTQACLANWTACGEFEDECDIIGIQYKQCSGLKCNTSGQCVDSKWSVSQNCNRDTDGLTCSDGTNCTKDDKCNLGTCKGTPETDNYDGGFPGASIGSYNDCGSSSSAWKDYTLLSIGESDWFSAHSDDWEGCFIYPHVEWTSYAGPITVCGWYRCDGTGSGSCKKTVECKVGTQTAWPKNSGCVGTPGIDECAGCCVTGVTGMIELDPDSYGIQQDQSGTLYFFASNGSGTQCAGVELRVGF